MTAEDALQALARLIAPIVAREVVRELRAGDHDGMVDQVASPLGRRRHCAAVRRRVQRGEAGAAIVGRRHLLSREALEVELATASKRSRPRKAPAPEAPPPVDDLATLRERYGLRRAS